MARTMKYLSACAAVVCVSLVARAADLETGDWTGTVTPPDGEMAQVTFAVSEEAGEPRITISAMGMMLDFRDIEVTDSSIAFTWTPGPDVRCTLDLQDDSSYSGACTDPDGGTGHITMVPPE